MPTQSISEIVSRSTGAGLPTAKDSPEKIRDSAQQFEALLIGQIMRTSRESDGGWLGSGDDQTSESMSEFAEQQMAQVLSASGGLGLASMIEKGLARDAQPQMLTDSAGAKGADPA